MSLHAETFKCDGKRCPNTAERPESAGWIRSSGEVRVGGKVLHDHRSVAGHYCSWACFAGQSVLDL
jgi:hypothetical protein